MTQGIRAYVNARFAKYLAAFAAAELTATEFRKKVMDGAVTKFGISVASAATHYNHALKMQRLADPKSVEGLGRPEDKKGGRPAQSTVNVINVRSGRIVAEGVSKGAAQLLILKAGTNKNGANKLSMTEPVAVEA